MALHCGSLAWFAHPGHPWLDCHGSFHRAWGETAKQALGAARRPTRP